MPNDSARDPDECAASLGYEGKLWEMPDALRG
jgi:hypothetical protein